MNDSGMPTTKDIYVQHYEQFRNMNSILYRLPVIFSTILGALYYFAFSFLASSKVVAIFVLLFAIVVATSGVMIVYRFGLAFNAYINNLNQLDREFKVNIKGSHCPSILSNIKGLLVISVIMSIVAIGMIYTDVLVVKLAAKSNLTLSKEQICPKANIRKPIINV